jgi:hypothetical protein
MKNYINFPNLMEINLYSNLITDEGLKALAAAAVNFPQLKVINLRRNYITYEGL